MRFSRLISFSILLLCVKAPGQELTIVPDLRFENFNDERNFTSGYIGNVTVDNKGYLWAAGNGLFRFDGVRVQQYSNFNNQYHGLRGNYSDDLMTDRFGRLWIGNQLGLCYFNDTLGKFQYIDKDTKTPILYAFAFLLSENEMWLICNIGLCKLNLQSLAITETSLKELTDPIEVFQLAGTLLGISTRTGLYLYDVMKNTWTKKVFTDQGNTIRIRQCILNNGKYWVATNRGLWQLEETGEHIYPVNGTGHLNISNLAFHPLDKQKKFIWLSTTNNGLQLFNISTQLIEYSFSHDDANPHSLHSNNISSMHFDKMHRLWLATENGVSMFDYRKQYWKTRKLNFREGITADNEIRKTVQDNVEKDKVWMSCINQGILLVDWKSKQILKHYKNFPSELSLTFADIRQLADGNWVLLGRNKLIKWNPVTGSIMSNLDFPVSPSVPVNLELTSIIQGDPDDLYITSITGLYLYHPSSNTLQQVLKREGQDMYSPYDLQQGIFDKNGILWLASRKGLVKYDPRNKEVSTFYNSRPDSATANYLFQVAYGKNGLILCGSSTGIGIFDISNETYSFINEFGTITNPACFTVNVKDSFAWVNSNAGLLRLNLYSKKAESIEITQEVNIYSPTAFGQVNDELVIGYRNMYAYFNPQHIAAADLPSNPVIERILLNNVPFNRISHDDLEYTFTHKQNTFSFSFTAFEFNNPDQIKFRYKLEGHDAEWTYTDEQRNATYVRLPPGHYTFKLQAGNTQDQWNDDAAVFHIYIVPPFWLRWWFWPLVALSFVIAVIAIARKRISSIRKREEEKTAVNKSMAELETQLLRSQMNPHFIFNSLNSIQKYIWENKEEDAAEYLAKFAKLIRAILENSRKETVTLQEELDMMKLYVELEHRRSNGKFEYLIKTSESLDTGNILVPPMLLQPFIENAIWHGLNKKETQGHLFISVIREKNNLVCIIDDDGVGRSASAKTATTTGKKSLGIEITRQRVELLHQSSSQTADIRITDKEEMGLPTGTTVTVTIPIQYYTGNA